MRSRTSPSRLDRLLDRLQTFYGALPSPPRDPFALFVWEVLSARSTPRKRDAAFGALKRIRALTPDAIARVPQKKLEESVALAGSYLEQRLRALREGADRFRRSPGLPKTIRGPIIAARRGVRGLPEMAEGGAYRILLFAAGHPVMPIDPGIVRVSRRLGYGQPQPTAAAAARSVRTALAGELQADPDRFRRAFLYLDHHASATCTEGDPHCTICPLLSECPEGQRRA